MKTKKIKQHKSRIPFFIGTALLVCLLCATSAWSHKVHVFAWVEGDKVYTESFFSNGKKAMNAPIEVFDGNGKLILSGKTDKSGSFTFKLPLCKDMRIVLNASEGHRAEYRLLIKE